MKNTPKIIFFIITILINLTLINKSWAGGGYYVGADYMLNSIESSVLTSVSGATSSTITDRNEQKTNSQDYGFRVGYNHKINKHIYISPEFFYQTLDNSSYLYSTTMKAGFMVKDFSFFASLGYAEIDKFNNSAENFGGGIEYKINDNFSIGAEYIKFGNVRTSEQDIGTFSTVTDKENRLQTIKFGITYYFHE